MEWGSVMGVIEEEEAVLTRTFEEHKGQFMTGQAKLGDFGLRSPLIDVWEGTNLDTFVLQPEVPCGETPIFFSKTKPWRPTEGHSGGPVRSINSKTDFLNNFKIFTNNVFEGWDDWSNMLIAGSSVVASCLPIPEEYTSSDELKAKYFHEIEYKASDIDIFLYGLTVPQYLQKLLSLHDFLKAKFPNLLVFQTPNTVTFVTSYPTRHIQVILSIWVSPEELLIQPVIDCTCVGYDGKTLWATQRSRLSFNHRTITTSEKKYKTKGTPEFETRLAKCSLHGFEIITPGFSWDRVNMGLLSYNKPLLLQDPKTRNVKGMSLLLCGYLYEEVREKCPLIFMNNWKNHGIPYGPTWDTQLIKENFKPEPAGSGYYYKGTSKKFCLIEGDVKGAFEGLPIILYSLPTLKTPPWTNTVYYLPEELVMRERMNSVFYVKLEPESPDMILINPSQKLTQVIPPPTGITLSPETYRPNITILSDLLTEWSKSSGHSLPNQDCIQFLFKQQD